MWGANYFPNIDLTTHEGKKVKFFDDLVKGKVVAINFIYTSCPDACPMETARMREVKQLLGDRVGKDVFFYSISIDPEHDTPEVLNAYVKNWDLGEGWTFLTGNREEIIGLRKKLGVYSDEDEAQELKKDHNLNLIIGNQNTGRWMKRSPYENPYVLATQIGSWLSNWERPSEEKRPYDEAPELRQIGQGETIFRTRCSACHTVGGGDTSVVAERRVGPDLYNISKLRDRKWLTRWIIEPDAMIREGDPIAKSLVAQYNNIEMPNLRMTVGDVAVLLEYIDQESARIDATLESNHVNAPAPTGQMRHQMNP